MRSCVGILALGAAICFAPMSASAIAPPYKTDLELSQYPIIVIGSWDRAPARPHRLIEGNVCRKSEMFTEMNVHRVLKGNITPGKHTIIFGYGIGWRKDGTGLQTRTSTDIPGDVDNVTKPNIWFLNTEKSWDSSDETLYYHLPNYRAIQPIELEPFFKALASEDRDKRIPILLESDNALVLRRSLRHICGGIWPWPNDPRAYERGIWTPRKRGRVLKEHADAVRKLVDRDVGEIRVLSASVYAELAGAKCVIYMRALLNDRDEDVRATAAGILALHKDTASLDAMPEAVADVDDSLLACKLIEALSNWDDRRVIPILISFLQNDAGIHQSGIPAMKSRARLARITGHWFPYDVAAATVAWKKVKNEVDPERRLRLLRELLPGSRFPVVAELTMEARRKNGRQRATVRLRNTSSGDVVIARRPNQVSQSWRNGSSSGSSSYGMWNDDEIKEEDFVTLHSGETYEVDLSFLLTEGENRTLELLYRNNGNAIGINAWIGVLKGNFGTVEKME